MGYHGSGSSLNSQIDGSEHGSDGKEPACNAGDSALIPGLRRFPGVGNDIHSGLKNCMNRGVWRATVPGGRKKSDTTER